MVNQRYGLTIKGSRGKEYFIAMNKYVAYDENNNLVEKEEILKDHQIRSAFKDDGTMLTFEPGTYQLDFGFINTVQRTLTPEDMEFNFDIFLMNDQQMTAVLNAVEYASYVDSFFSFAFWVVVTGSIITCIFGLYWNVALNEEGRNRLKQNVSDLMDRPKPLIGGNKIMSYRELGEGEIYELH